MLPLTRADSNSIIEIINMINASMLNGEGHYHHLDYLKEYNKRTLLSDLSGNILSFWEEQFIPTLFFGLEYKRFWAGVVVNGNKTNYQISVICGEQWNDDYKLDSPPWPFRITSTYNLIAKQNKLDIKKLEKQLQLYIGEILRKT